MYEPNEPAWRVALPLIGVALVLSFAGALVLGVITALLYTWYPPNTLGVSACYNGTTKIDISFYNDCFGMRPEYKEEVKKNINYVTITLDGEIIDKINGTLIKDEYTYNVSAERHELIVTFFGINGEAHERKFPNKWLEKYS